jgi:hypothetical protein
MSNKKYSNRILVAIWHFLNQRLVATETVFNPVRFWHIYQNRQILEECWHYDVIQSLEKCWNIPEIQLSDNRLPSENDSHSIGV